MHEVAKINYIYDLIGLKKGDLQCLPKMMAHVTPQLIIAPVERMQFFFNSKYFATYQLNMNISDTFKLHVINNYVKSKCMHHENTS